MSGSTTDPLSGPENSDKILSPEVELVPLDDTLSPSEDANGIITSTRDEYLKQLNKFRLKKPLQEACAALHLSVPKSASLERLRSVLLNHWYPALLNRPSSPNQSHQGSCSLSTLPTTPTRIASPHQIRSHISGRNYVDDDDADDEEDLVREFAVEGAAADEVLGYDEDNDLDEGDDDIEDSDSKVELRLGDPENFKAFQKRIRVEETQRAEQNRRAGGIKTQQAMVKAWEEFCENALEEGKIKDRIIDEHHLLLYIRFCSERPKRNRRGVDIPGTFIGASQIKKLYFGALRIRKEQEALDPSLQRIRPVTTVHVWDSLKGRMNEALQRVRNGLVPEEDAPDIVANTFLAEITEEQMEKVGRGFLMHRELRSIINGHLCWTAQNASGNRGDDFRALRLAELQPYTFLHPNQETAIPSILGLQGEEKAGASRGMRTKINPVYTVFIAHLDPVKCPLGAFALYHHFIHDVANIGKVMEIDWSVNKSWRQVRILHGKKSFTTPYHEQSLYNLYVKAFQSAEFVSRLKAHLPRHILGYRQEKMGVDASVTSRMGWVRGETYFDTYAPALPKEAILGAHGYRTHEVYDPVWRHVHVPESFLRLVCPMAEEIHDDIVGRKNLSGAANYWSMVIFLRPYLFQCGAAIYQECPKSGIFRLPALANPDVQNWMKNEFPKSLTLLKASAGSRVDLQRIQNQELRRSLEEVRSLLSSQTVELSAVRRLLERRTAVLSPTKSFSNEVYQSRYSNAQGSTSQSQSPFRPLFVLGNSNDLDVSDDDAHPLSPSPAQRLFVHDVLTSQPIPADDTGVYVADEEGTFRAFANASPKAPKQRQKTQVDLVLPPAAAFSKQGDPQLFWPPILGQKSVQWDQVFELVKRPEMLWDCWKPAKTVDKYGLREQWTCWSVGEAVINASGIQTGIKPPLREVERHFLKPSWRSKMSSKARKQWSRFREIPEYIDSESRSREVSPMEIIAELENLGVENPKLKGLSALTNHIKGQREEMVKSKNTLSIIDAAADLVNSNEEESLSTTGRKRKAPVDARRCSKKSKTS